MSSFLDRHFPGRRARRSMSVVLLMVCGTIGVLAFEMQGRAQWAEETLEQITPRYARLAGLQHAESKITQSLHESQEHLAQFLYSPDTPVERIGTELQQRLRALATENGLAVPNSNILPAMSGEFIEIVSVVLTVQGSSEQFSRLLVSLQQERPALQVDEIQLAGGRGKARGQLSAQITISAMRLKS